MVLKGFSKNPLTHGLANGLTNGIQVYAAKPDFRRAPIKVFRNALKLSERNRFFPARLSAGATLRSIILLC